MAKQLDLTRSVYELARQYPELVEIMAGLGFTEIAKPAMLHSVGKLMTIPKGARMKQLDLATIVRALEDKGFQVLGTDAAEDAAAPAAGGAARAAQLKSFLRRLGAGEDLEAVRADFARDFREVDAAEIMRAEQELMAEGTPLAEVQRLCDLHSALFHGATKAERIAAAEAAVAASLERQKQFPQGDYTDKNEKAAALAAIPGHPLHSFSRENEALTALLEQFKSSRDVSLLPAIRELSIHYAKKGDLLYPLLKVRYGVSGPSDVMWTVDDEIRDELAALDRESSRGGDWQQRLDAVLRRAEEMIYKEQNILFPICAVNFSAAEWQGVYRDAKDYAPCFGVESALWPEGEAAAPPAPAGQEGEIRMPGGHLSLVQLTAMLNTIPLEISFVDAENINRYFNEGPKVFKRPGMAIDREVFSCHPPKIEPMVRSIIQSFRDGIRDRVPVWMEKGGRSMLVTYMAVRDRDGQYLGTMELVQDMEEIKAHFQEG